ncbi:unnamed protein product [Schistosoma curassoni]|uniref:DUF1013 domain-containing protein n=1 Tax=Schistosoma curassoni TaxID=6186 RepID=A0A183KPF1_9TREM|nr:unnamed protein product [Schistosoma curassoni]
MGSIRADKQRYVEELATTAEKAARKGNMKQLSDATKKLAWKYGKPDRLVMDKEFNPITEIAEHRNIPVPLNPQNIVATHTNIPMDITPPTIDEIRMTIRQIKKWKSPEPGNIPAEAMKSDIEEDLGRGTSTDRLDRSMPHQDAKERRCEHQPQE